MTNLRQYALYLGLLLPSLWIFLTLLASPSTSRQIQYNQKKLNLFNEWIDSFHEKFGRLPENFAELRVYMRSSGFRISPYDPWASRYQYEKLSKDTFFLKSFGPDATENNLANAIDQTYIRMAPLPKRPPIQLAQDQSALNLYPGPLLLAAQSPSNPYVAELAINPASNVKRLVVRNLLEKNFILVSFHDQIHEFFWLPNGYEIVFTASGSRRYEDGVYIWNLISNTTKNVLSDLKASFPSINRERLYFSLSTIDHRSQRIFLFIQPMEEAFLDPIQYYHTSNLFAIILPGQSESEEWRFEHYDTADFGLFQRDINPQGILPSDFDGYPAQMDWTKLRVSGSIQEVLEQWQNFCANYTDTAVFPYCLWWLASLYHDTYQVLKQSRSQEAHVIRNFGVEIAQALDELKFAPDYLRAMGLFLKNSLLEQKAIGYRLSNLHP